MLLVSKSGNGIFVERYSDRAERDARCRAIKKAGGVAIKETLRNSFEVAFRPGWVRRAMARHYRRHSHD